MTGAIDRSFIDRALSGAKMVPFWLDNPACPAPEPKLHGTHHADLVVVGGGFTGLWAAILAKERSPELDVVLIERDRIAFGASGRPGGIISTSIMHGLKNTARVFPADIAELERLGQENLDGFREAIERYGIDADLEWNGEMTVAVADDDLDELREEYELHRRHGHDVEFLDHKAVRRQLDSPLFRGAMWSHERSGTVHPAKLAWGLRAAAKTLGVRIHEQTPLLSLQDSGADLLVRTPESEILAHRVFLATNAWSAGHKAIANRVMTMRDHVLATEPLTAEQLSRIGWRARQGVYDTGAELNYMRLTRDNRIVFGGSVAYHFGNGTDPAADRDIATYRGLAEDFYEKFPQLKDVRISHVWGGPIDFCSRYSMFFDRYHGGSAVYVGGYSGFGVGGSRFGARIGLALLTGDDLPELKLDIVCERPATIPPEPFRWIGAMITLHVTRQPGEKRGWHLLWFKYLKRLGFPF